MTAAAMEELLPSLLAKPSANQVLSLADCGHGWRCLSTQLKTNRSYVDIYYGSADDEDRPPTIVMGISRQKQPKLAKSQIFSKPWPGEQLQGCELHASGDTIGWNNADPLNFDPAHNTWLKKKTFPNSRFRMQVYGRHVIVMHGAHVLHRFSEPVLHPDEASLLFFHLYIQDADMEQSQQTPILENLDVALACHTARSIVISMSEEDDTTYSAIRQACSLAPILMKNHMLSAYSAGEELFKNLIAFASPLTGAALRQGHNGRISALNIFPDGRFILTFGLDDGRALVWNVKTGRRVCDLAKELDITDPHMGPGVRLLPNKSLTGARVELDMTFKCFVSGTGDMEADQASRMCNIAVDVYDPHDCNERSFEFQMEFPELLKLSEQKSQDKLQQRNELKEVKIRVKGVIVGMETETENHVLGNEQPRYFSIKFGAKTLQIHADRLKLADVMSPGFNCGDVWSMQGEVQRDLVALARQDNWILIVDVIHQGKNMICTHACMFLHEEEGINGSRAKSAVGVRGVKYSSKINKLFTCGGGVVRMWHIERRNQHQLEEEQHQQFAKRPSSQSSTRQSVPSSMRQSVSSSMRQSASSTASTESSVEWTCVEGGTQKPFFEVPCGEDIRSMHMLESDPANEEEQQDPYELLRLAVATSSDKQAGRVYIIDGKGQTKSTVTIPKHQGDVSVVRLHYGTNHIYLIAGTRSGNILIIKISNSGEEIDLSCYNGWSQLMHSPKVSVWACAVIPYKFVKEEVVYRSQLLITTSGDTTIKLWSFDKEVKRIHQGCQQEHDSILTLSRHTGAVTALGFKEDVDEDGAEVHMCIYTVSWDGMCIRWALDDLLGNRDLPCAYKLYAMPPPDKEESVPFQQQAQNIVDWVNSKVERSAPMPQQVYRSITVFEAIASPMSWCLAIVQLGYAGLKAKGNHWNKGQQREGLFFGLGWNVPFWYEYFIVTAMAWPYVLVLLIDRHNIVKGEISELAAKQNADSNWRIQKKLAELKSSFDSTSSFLWFWSQMLWVPLFKYIVMTFDCTYLSHVNNSPEWRKDVATMHHYKGDVLVMDEDRGMQCFAGRHIAVATYGFVLLWLYVFLSIPLLIGLGDCNLVVPLPWYVRCSPLQLIRTIQFRAQRQQWPKYAGAFTRCTNYYLFETSLTSAKVMIPSIIVVTTYMPGLRNYSIQAIGLALFYMSSNKSPVQHPLPAVGLTLLSFMLCFIPAVKLYSNDQLAIRHCEAMLAQQHVTGIHGP